MLWFLRLFSRFRELERAIEQVPALEERVASATEQASWLRGQLEEALTNERSSYRMSVNEHWQMKYGVRPFPEAPGLPVKLERAETPAPLPAQAITGSRLVSMAEQRFFEGAERD